ncbi:SPOSA6832_02899 [Sporobolomyces salmonicolor]|uniref:SPOSA6832_02899-mRNA-1:cds n=1 Tax=Sporidiobolus salmonicolor TaxID=5005 RepID=A0A0D6EMU1_SPOSA|nr:SPOSA6832_02899 [Sporobolomyces salmonicolor]
MLPALRRVTALNGHISRNLNLELNRAFSVSSASMSTPNDRALAAGPEKLKAPGLVLLVSQTPNGGKPVYYLEELKAAGAIKGYEHIDISLSKNEQKEDWFEAVNPNGRIPALLDNREGKKPIKVWESASILLYLARNYDKDYLFHFEDDDLHQEMLNWIFFLQGGVGPMQVRYAPEKIQYGVDRYQNETRRLFGIYEDHLAGKKDGEKKEWLVGGKFSIRMSSWAGVSLDPFPLLKDWVERIDARPAIQSALKIPEQDMLTKMKEDPSLEEKIMKASAAWVQKGNEGLKNK